MIYSCIWLDRVGRTYLHVYVLSKLKISSITLFVGTLPGPCLFSLSMEDYTIILTKNNI